MNRISHMRTNGNINVVVLEKHDERYMFLFDDANSKRCQRRLGKLALNKQLSFDFSDAWRVLQFIRAISSTEL